MLTMRDLTMQAFSQQSTCDTVHVIKPRSQLDEVSESVPNKPNACILSLQLIQQSNANSRCSSLCWTALRLCRRTLHIDLYSKEQHRQRNGFTLQCVAALQTQNDIWPSLAYRHQVCVQYLRAGVHEGYWLELTVALL